MWLPYIWCYDMEVASLFNKWLVSGCEEKLLRPYFSWTRAGFWEMLKALLHQFCPYKHAKNCFVTFYHGVKKCLLLPPYSLIWDFRKQNTRDNVSKISVNHTCSWQIGSKSTNHNSLAWRKEGLKVTLVAVIGGFRSNLSITCMIDGKFGNVSAGVLFSKVAYQRKWW